MFLLIFLSSCKTDVSGTVANMKYIDDFTFSELTREDFKIIGPFISKSQTKSKSGIIDLSTDTGKYGYIGSDNIIAIKQFLDSGNLSLKTLSVNNNNKKDALNVAIWNALYEVIEQANQAGADYLFMPRYQVTKQQSNSEVIFEATVYAKGIIILGSE